MTNDEEFFFNHQLDLVRQISLEVSDMESRLQRIEETSNKRWRLVVWAFWISAVLVASKLDPNSDNLAGAVLVLYGLWRGGRWAWRKAAKWWK